MAELFPSTNSPDSIERCRGCLCVRRLKGPTSYILVCDPHRHPIEREVTRGVAGDIDDPHPEVGVREVGAAQVRPHVSAAPPSV